MRIAAITELLARYSKGEADREMAMFAALPEDKQRHVESRLRAIDEYRRDHGAGQAVAKRLEIAPRSLYRLAAKVDEVGPVTALSPRLGAGRKRRSDASGGLPPAAESKLREMLARHPDIGWSELVDAVARACDPSPSPAAIRRRAMDLRREYVPPPSALVGRSLLLDQIAFAIPVKSGGSVALLVADVLLDRETRLILATAPVERGSEWDGPLGWLAREAAGGLRELRSPWKVAEHLEALTWVVGEGLDEDAVAKVADIAGAMAPPVDVKIVDKGKFRRGSELVRLIGDRLLSVQLMQRATVDPVIEPGGKAFSAGQAHQALKIIANDWNGALVKRAGGKVRESRGEAEPLIDQLGSLLSPVVGSLARRDMRGKW